MTCKDCVHEKVCKVVDAVGSNLDNAEVVCGYFKNKADYAEVKHGEWVLTKTEFGWNCCKYPTEYKCSLCGRTAKQEEPYCPHCGAKMDGVKNV